MFATVDYVLRKTGYSVSSDEVYRAQGIIESYIGRTEDEIESPSDHAVLGNAVAYQAAYMHNNADRVWEQVAISYQAQTDGGASLRSDLDAPFIAPLAAIAMRRLSWKRSHSIKVGSMFSHSGPRYDWKRD